MKLNNNETIKLVGGAGISATLINAFTNIIKFVYQMGQNFGSSIRRKKSGYTC